MPKGGLRKATKGEALRRRLPLARLARETISAAGGPIEGGNERTVPIPQSCARCGGSNGVHRLLDLADRTGHRLRPPCLEGCTLDGRKSVSPGREEGQICEEAVSTQLTAQQPLEHTL